MEYLTCNMNISNCSSLYQVLARGVNMALPTGSCVDESLSRWGND